MRLSMLVRRCAAAAVAAGAVAAVAAALAAPAGAAGEETPDVFVAVKGAHVITVSGEEIAAGTIVIKNGVIEAVGPNVEIPFPARIIDAQGLWVMPGLINPCTLAGAQQYRRGGVQAHLKVADEFRPEEETLSEIVRCGFTVLGFRPAGGGICGTGMAARLAADGSAGEVLNAEAFVFMDAGSPPQDKKTIRDAFKAAQNEIEKQEKARKEWEEKQKKAAEEAKKKAEEAKKEAEKKEGEQNEGDQKGEAAGEAKKEEEAKFKPPEMSPPLVPLVRLIRKEEGLKALVAIGQAGDFEQLEDAIKGFEFRRAYLLEAGRRWSDADFHLAAEALGAEKAEVVVEPALSTFPLTRNRYNLPVLLAEAGCTVSLRPANDGIEAHAELLRQAAALVRAGLDRTVALKAMTLHPAQFLGIAGRAGSIEPGRDADLLFLSGDPFGAETRVEKVMLKGEVVEGNHAIQ